MKTVAVLLVMCAAAHRCMCYPGQTLGCDSNSDVVFALDSSNNMSPGTLATATELLLRLVAAFGAGGRARFGLLTFSDEATRRFDLNDFNTAESVRDAIDNMNITTDGSRSIAGAISGILGMFREESGDRDASRNIGMVMTAGRQDAEWRNSEVASQADSQNVRLIAIAVGDDVINTDPCDVSPGPVDSDVYVVSDVAAITDILQELCDNLTDIEEITPICPGDQVWMECDAGCQRTCADPEPVCEESCVPGCQCPPITPLLLHPRDSSSDPICVTQNDCPVTGYNCNSNNPCSPSLRVSGQYYYPHDQATKYVQCSQWGQCWEMPCPAGTQWNEQAYTCTRA